MELTTQQLYAIFAMLTTSALAGLIFYCVGLRAGKGAGYELGHHAAKNYWKKIACNARTELGEARDLLNARTREMATLRQCIEQETADHHAAMAKLKEHWDFAVTWRDKAILELRGRLQHETAERLTTDDWLNLKLAAKQLGITAHQHARSGSAKTNQAEQAQACITALAARVKAILDQPPRLCQMSEHGITDTALIEWLNTHGDYWAEIDNATLRFDVNSPEEGFEHLRDVLTLAIQQKRADTTTAGNAISQFMDARSERAA